jgi:hypothetical protein
MKKALSRMVETLQSLHHSSIGYEHACTRIGLARKAKFLQIHLRTHARTRKITTKLADE